MRDGQRVEKVNRGRVYEDHRDPSTPPRRTERCFPPSPSVLSYGYFTPAANRRRHYSTVTSHFLSRVGLFM